MGPGIQQVLFVQAWWASCRMAAAWRTGAAVSVEKRRSAISIRPSDRRRLQPHGRSDRTRSSRGRRLLSADGSRATGVPELRVADFDGDGYDDLLMAQNLSAGPYWWQCSAAPGPVCRRPRSRQRFPDSTGLDVNGTRWPTRRAGIERCSVDVVSARGAPGDLLASVTDGSASWSRAPMSSSSVYGTERPTQSPIWVARVRWYVNSSSPMAPARTGLTP